MPGFGREPFGSGPFGSATGGDSNGWKALLGIMRGIRSENARIAVQIGTDCPNDGTTLLPGTDGRLHCPFDGWSGTARQAVPRGPAFVVTADPDPDPVPVGSYGDIYTTTYGGGPASTD